MRHAHACDTRWGQYYPHLVTSHKMSKSARNFVFTYNLRSPTVARSFIADAEGFVKAGHLRGIIFQLEIAPTSGQHHFQGYLELPKPQRISALHKLFEGHALHYEDRRGTRDQAVEYSTKEDTRGPAVDPDDEEAWPAAGPYAFPNREFFGGSKQVSDPRPAEAKRGGALQY